MTVAPGLWWDTLPAELRGPPRPPLPGDRDADVAIVGAGYTGLWTAYYLLAAEPTLRVVVLEREVAGFGASGRNGGWCSALFPASLEALARASSPGEALRLRRAMEATVDEVGRVAALEGIDAQLAKGGTVTVARTTAQLRRQRDAVSRARSFGVGEEDVRLLTATETRGLVDMRGALGGMHDRHCACVHPARLVRGLAVAVERRGALVYEQTPVTGIEPGVVRTAHGAVRAPYIVRATEGFTAGLPGLRRTLAPVYSLMVASEPLSDELWRRIGLGSRPTFRDARHLVVYGQRTADGRLAFGGRGAPYHRGSRVRPAYDRDEHVFEAVRARLRGMFPVLDGVRFTHAWGGPLGIARDWWASCGLDGGTGLAWAGGYVGDGVGTSNLAGRTLADLLLRRDTELVTLPWVGHRSRRWEPEPLRWLGVNAGLRAMSLADPEESRTGRPSVLARAFGRLMHG